MAKATTNIADPKPGMLFSVCRGVSIGAIAGIGAHKVAPAASARVVGRVLGLGTHAGFGGLESAALTGLTVAAAAGGIGGIYGALDNTLNRDDR